MTGKLPQEQPPTDDPIRLKEWLTRLVIDINGLIQTTFNFGITSVTDIFQQSSALQVPTGLDVPLLIEFGPALVTENLDLAADGTVTVLKKNDYEVEIIMHPKRTNAGAAAHLLFYATINGNAIPLSLLVILDTQRTSVPVTIFISDQFLAGTELKVFMVRDSSGLDDGRLEGLTAALSSVPDAPSASLNISTRPIKFK